MSRHFSEGEPEPRLRRFKGLLPPLPDEGERMLFLRATPGGPRDTVVGCRVDPADLEAIDMLVEAGLRSSRSEAAAWLIRQGVQAQKGLLEQVTDTVAQIRKLREDAKAKAGKLADEEKGTS